MISSSILNNAASLHAAFSIGQNQTGPKDSLVQNSSLKPIEPLETTQQTNFRSRQPSPVVDNLSEESSAFGEEQKINQPIEAERKEAELEERQEKQVQQQEQREISALAARDREVRAHEQAHAAVGGQYAGAPTYEYQRGPDGVSYAVGGEVSIDTGKAATPQETLTKAQTIRRAALAPADPSPQDRRVAAQASRMESQARADISAERTAEIQKNKEERAESFDSADNIAADTSFFQEAEGVSGLTLDDRAGSVASSSQVQINSLDTPRSGFSNGNVSLAGERLLQALASTSDATSRPGTLLSQIV